MEERTLKRRFGEPATTRTLRLVWILLILLAAAGLRLVDLAEIPPGMTHDEADHGLTAWEIVNGARGLYFTVGYGREPLYDYATALVMAGTGPTILAARLTSVYFSLFMIAAVYAWTRRAFGLPAALLTAAGLAVGFWPVMAGRQALRSIALPAVFALAVLFFWQGVAARGSRGAGEQGRKLSPLLPRPPAPPHRPTILFAIAGALLGLTFYTYIPARVMWLAFPALAVYLAFAAPPTEGGIRRLLEGLALTLIVAAFVAAPLFFFLTNNPGLEVRIDELSAPLRVAAGGDLAPLWTNVRGALRLFTVEGDRTWRYNIPGKPFLGPVMGVLFYGGLVVAGWLSFARNRVFSEKLGFYQAASGAGAFLAVVWLALGMAPVFVTGPGLSMTQAIGAMPVLYLFPALTLVAVYNALATCYKLAARRQTNEGVVASRAMPSAVGVLFALLLFTALTTSTVRDYFGRWANEPQVRVQYEATMVSALGYLDKYGTGATAVSTITPDRYHTPAVALLTLRNPAVRPRWFDGRESLLLPGEAGSTMVIPGFTPLPDALQSYLAGAELSRELPMRPDDFDRPIRFYALDGTRAITLALDSMTTTADGVPLPARFGDSLELLGYDLAAAEARPGETLTLVTAWRVLSPLPDASLFAHIIGPDGRPIAQADSLGAPGESWVSGDVLLQLHTITLPADAVAGAYPLVVGVYTQPDGPRLTVNGGAADHVELTTIAVADE